MNEIIRNLGKMREHTDSEAYATYQESYKAASKFLIYQDEFIPFNLIEETQGDLTILEITEKYGPAQITTAHDKLLSAFYKNHNLKRDIYHIVDSIAYLQIPDEDPSPIVANKNVNIDDFFDVDILTKLAPNQNKRYSAKETQLREIGQAIGDYILTPTNHWLAQLQIDRFEDTPERYWQVAGVFKKKLWGKLQHTDHLDKKIFLCLGIDLENETLFYGLQCLRTGTSRLSTEQIFKFDLYTRDFNTLEKIDFNQINELNWQSLIGQSEEFIKKLIPLYDEVINYIWNDVVEIKSIRNHLIPLVAKLPNSSKEPIETNKKIKSLGVELVIAYEKEYLKYKGKKKLLKLVKKSSASNDHYDITSYHLDGSEKLIKVIASKSNTIQGAIISQACIDVSIVNTEKYYSYAVVNIGSKRKSGILYINKGRLDKVVNMKPYNYTISS